MSDNNHIDLDIIKILKEVNKQNLKNFELEYGDLKIKIDSTGKQENIVSELPTATSEQESQMEALEQKTIEERIKERDESLLDDLDYLAPELAGDLQRANIIKLGNDGCYEYVEEEGLHA